MSNLLFFCSEADEDRLAAVKDALENLEFKVETSAFQGDEAVEEEEVKKSINSVHHCILFWSSGSGVAGKIYQVITSVNQQDKVIHVLLDDLPASKIPEGISEDQCISLTSTNISDQAPEWQKLLAVIKKQESSLLEKEKLIFKNEHSETYQSKYQAAVNQCDYLKQEWDREIAKHNQFRQSRAGVYAEAKEAKQEVETLTIALQGEKSKSEKLAQKLQTQATKKHSNATLVSTIILSCLAGAVAIFFYLAQPLQQKFQASFVKISTLQDEKTRALKSIETLKRTVAQQDGLAKSISQKNTSKKAQINELKTLLNKITTEKKEAQSALKISKAKLKGIAQKLSKSEKLRSASKLQSEKLKAELKDTKATLSLINNKLKKAEDKLSSDREELIAFKQNAYREIANVKKDTSRQVTVLQKRVRQIQVQLNKARKKKVSQN